MQQYLELLKAIKERGTVKPAAREGMPSTLSLFGYQFRHNLQEGFPLLTTKKMAWKNVVTELLWFLRGDTNIKYLVDNGCNIWNEDAYNYYLKMSGNAFTFENFIQHIKDNKLFYGSNGYKIGDCGYQYGKVWRDWEKEEGERPYDISFGKIDQIANVIKSLKETPESRRHIVTAIDPAHDKDLALYWCHALFQFNCRPLTWEEKAQWYINKINSNIVTYDMLSNDFDKKEFTFGKVPQYYLDCQLYQRSADVILGVPFNIASYALLIHIMAKICNMIPGDFIHTFGDVHIYSNHMDAVQEQLTREPRTLPNLVITNLDWDDILKHNFETAIPDYFKVENYNPHSAIKAELSTGLKK